MQEQTMEHEDATIGIECKVEKHNNSQNRIRFKSSFANIGENIVALTLSEHSNYLQQMQHVNECNKKINQLQQEVDSNDIKALKKQLGIYEKQVDNLTKSNNSYKQWNDEFKSKINDLEQTIDELKEHNNAIAKQLENTIDASEFKKSQNEINHLKEQVDKYKSKYENMLSDYTKATDECIAYLDENKKLKETNQFLNEQVGAITSTFNKINAEFESNYKSSNQELKETIKKQQTHIDEITEKYQSLLNKKDYINPTSHYDEILALTNDLNDANLKINELNSDIETKLAVQKNELDSEHTKEKAQMLVAYNKELDNLKLQYNNLANDYNNLLNDVSTITKWNALFDSRHKKIKKDKQQIELMKLPSEQLPSSDEDVLEYVPKD